MKAGSEPQSERQTYGEMAAANLRSAGWELCLNEGEDVSVVHARKNEQRIIVFAPEIGVALLEAERQARTL